MPLSAAPRPAPDAPIPWLSGLGPHLGAPVQVRRLPGPRVLWLNRRWFLQAGVNILDPEVRAVQERWLTETYAVRCSDDAGPHAGEAASDYFADRYGGSGGAPHGGSGRCIVHGDFNAKGVGRTPLVAEHVDWEHAHGFLPLVDAVREAVCAEIAAAETPYGAVPIVAIIDTGERYARDSNQTPQRAAIVVRPNFIRPAHFERSVFFGSAGSPDSDQFIDALRVKDAIVAVAERAAELRIQFDGPADMFRRFADQLGATRALRLWQGRLLTSNLSIDGAMVDFGAFCSIPTWQRAVRSTYVGFGDEERYFGWAVTSLGHFFQKYGPKRFRLPPRASFLAELSELCQESFVRTNLAALIPPQAGAAETDLARVRELLLEYFDLQQSIRVDHDTATGSPWISTLAERPGWDGCGDGGAHDRLASALLQALASCAGEADQDASRRRIRRWFRPRPEIEHYRLTCDVAALVETLTGGPADIGLVRGFITNRINLSRRYFPELPQHLDLRAYRAQEHCQSWLAADFTQGRQVTIIEALGVGDDLAIFDGLTPLARAERFIIDERAGRFRLEVPADEAGARFLSALERPDPQPWVSSEAPAHVPAPSAMERAQQP